MVISSIKLIVRNTAMGSFVPDSSSISGLTVPFRFKFLKLKIENTAAASVEETTDPSSKLTKNGSWKTKCTNKPTANVVIRTPMVERLKEDNKTGSTFFHLVSRPPENSINTSEIIPID